MAKYNDITSFLTAVNALLEDNTSGNITAQDMRTVMKDIADTFGFRSGELSDVRLRFNTVNTNTIQAQKRSDTGGWQDAGQLNIGTIQKFNTLINSFGAQLQLTGGKNELALVTKRALRLRLSCLIWVACLNGLIIIPKAKLIICLHILATFIV